MDFDWKRGVIGIAALAVLVVALFLTFNSEGCLNFDCFQQNMIECSSADYINEEPEASWGYEILGKNEGKCDVKVTLLSAKEGSLELRQYEGDSMTCSYESGIFAYPEKDLDACSGELKENLQSVIIKKLYEYIVDNVGDISEELGKV